MDLVWLKVLRKSCTDPYLFFTQIPSVYTGDLLDTDDVFDWISKNQASSVIEEVTDEILEELIKDHEYVAVFFRGSCEDENDDCDGSGSSSEDCSSCFARS